MTTLHLARGVLVAVAVGATFVTVAVGFVAGYRPRLVDRLILLDLGAVAGAVVVGALLLVTGERPADPLHFLYAVVALLAFPVARYFGRSGTSRRRTTIMAIGCLVAAGVVARLFMTGA